MIHLKPPERAIAFGSAQVGSAAGFSSAFRGRFRVAKISPGGKKAAVFSRSSPGAAALQWDRSCPEAPRPKRASYTPGRASTNKPSPTSRKRSAETQLLLPSDFHVAGRLSKPARAMANFDEAIRLNQWPARFGSIPEQMRRDAIIRRLSSWHQRWVPRWSADVSARDRDEPRRQEENDFAGALK